MHRLGVQSGTDDITHRIGCNVSRDDAATDGENAQTPAVIHHLALPVGSQLGQSWEFLVQGLSDTAELRSVQADPNHRNGVR